MFQANVVIGLHRTRISQVRQFCQ